MALLKKLERFHLTVLFELDEEESPAMDDELGMDKILNGSVRGSMAELSQEIERQLLVYHSIAATRITATVLPDRAP